MQPAIYEQVKKVPTNKILCYSLSYKLRLSWAVATDQSKSAIAKVMTSLEVYKSTLVP